MRADYSGALRTIRDSKKARDDASNKRRGSQLNRLSSLSSHRSALDFGYNTGNFILRMAPAFSFLANCFDRLFASCYTRLLKTFKEGIVKMNTVAKINGIFIGFACIGIVLCGCATEPSRVRTVTADIGRAEPDFFEGMEIVEQPELEPEWSDFVKESYPNWREHYWVDRGHWGNRGYLLGKPLAEAGPAVVAELTPLPPAPLSIVETAPPDFDAEPADRDLPSNAHASSGSSP